MEFIKIVVLGDGAVGKTRIVNNYAKGYSLDDENNNKSIAMTAWRYKRPIRLELCDSAGQNDYERLSSFCYTDTRVFLYCFSIIDPDSFENLKTKWHPNVKKFCPNASIILVGTKFDLRNDKDHIDKLKKKNQLLPITLKQGKQLADELSASDYLEYSEFMGLEKLKHIFDKALESVLKVKSKNYLNYNLRQRQCLI